MLDLARTQPSGTSRERFAVTHTTRHRFAFAGVAFEVLLEGGPWELPRSYAEHLLPLASTPVIADVTCSVSVDHGRFPGASEQGTLQPLSLQRSASGHVSCESGELCAEITRLTPARYVATARVAPTRAALGALLCTIAADLVRNTSHVGTLDAVLGARAKQIMHAFGDTRAEQPAALRVGMHEENV